MKRAIALSGGGPAVGLSIGALKRLAHEDDIHFDVWSTACVGAWVATIYNQATPGHEIEETEAFFRKIFTSDNSYAQFPIATIFAPNFHDYITKSLDYMMQPSSYQNLLIPEAMEEACDLVWKFATQPASWNQGNLNNVLFNGFFRVNPFTRFMTSLAWLGAPAGLSKVYYPNNDFLNSIQFDRLSEAGKPTIYHNAYNLTDHQIELFDNKGRYHPITAQSLCACSALPFVEESVEMNGKTYCEGATVHTINFEHLMHNHPDLDEIWVSRILDRRQMSKPDNLYEALNNLIMLFAATNSENDIELFRYKLQAHHPHVKLIEIPVPHDITYDWSHQNLENAMAQGFEATDTIVKQYRHLTERNIARVA